MQHDHRPYWIKKTYLKLQRSYVRHFLKPQLNSLGAGYFFLMPWNIRIFGHPIDIGQHLHIITAKDRIVSFCVWHQDKQRGHIDIGDYCLICPGVRIDSAHSIKIGNNCMIASNAYLTDADWHDLYNRTQAIGHHGAITLGDNVWIGDSAIVCKGVNIGDNSIIGAGSVVVHDIPANVIAAGNPAKVVKPLDDSQAFVTRDTLFANPKQLAQQMDQWDRQTLAKNSLWHWLRTLLFPQKHD